MSLGGAIIKRIKNITVSVIIFIFTIIIAGCDFTQQPEDDLTAEANGRGPFIEVVEVIAEFDEENSPEKIVNDSGMSGYDGLHHTHSNNENDMWVVSNANDDVTLTFDLGRIIPLGEMWIWNYNGHESEDDNIGLRNIEITISTDGENWEEWQGENYPYELASADGSDDLSATNLNTDDYPPINFEGTPIRFISISPSDEDGNWANSNDRFGLSQVRFIQHKEPLEENSHIIPYSVEVNGEIEDYYPLENIINTNGRINSNGYSTVPETMWLAESIQAEPFDLEFDLGGTYPLKELLIWNYSEEGNEDYGLRNIEISHSLDGETWIELFEEPVELPQTTNEENVSIETEDVFAKFIKITPSTEEGNWSDDNHYGLTAIEFIADSGMAAVPAYDWTELFSNYSGWTGADGTYSLPFDEEDNSYLFLFSDTLLGEVNPVNKHRVQEGMLNNSVAILEGTEPLSEQLEFTWIKESGEVELFTPDPSQFDSSSYFWLQDAVIIDDMLYLFPLMMVNDPGGDAGFRFAIDGIVMIKVPIDENGDLLFSQQEQVEAPLFERLDNDEGDILYGAAILDDTANEEEPFIYIYGYHDLDSGKKDLVVARATSEDFEDFDTWEYWNGENWSSDMQDSVVLVEEISPELSVDYIDSGMFEGQYLTVFEEDTLSGYIGLSTSDSPYGPFEETQTVYAIPEANNDDNIFTYNAKAHPHLSAENELLISYNVNSNSPHGNSTNADIYRPRWIKLVDID